MFLPWFDDRGWPFFVFFFFSPFLLLPLSPFLPSPSLFPLFFANPFANHSSSLVLLSISLFFRLFLFDISLVSSGFASCCCCFENDDLQYKVISFLDVKCLCIFVVALLLLMIDFVVLVFDLLLICAVFVVVVALLLLICSSSCCCVSYYSSCCCF